MTSNRFFRKSPSNQISEQSHLIIEQSNLVLDYIRILYEHIDELSMSIFISDYGLSFESKEQAETKERLNAVREVIEQIIISANSVPRTINELNAGVHSTHRRNVVYLTRDPLTNISDKLHCLRMACKQTDRISRNIQFSMHSSQIDSFIHAINQYEQQVNDFGEFLDDIILYLTNTNMEYNASISNQSCDFESAEKSNNSKFLKLSDVQFSAIVPKQAQHDEYLLISIYMYEEAFRSVVEDALNDESNAKEHKSGFFSVEDNTAVKIALSSPDLKDVEIETSPWNGKYLRFDFAPSIPEGFSKKQILFIASVFFNDVLTTKLKFAISIDDIKETKPQISRKDIFSAFISYASQDRSRVATIIQGMKKARPDLDVFFDVDNLRSGEKWEDVLRKEIDERDILYLFWSHFARESKWVDIEWRYALEKKGIDFIEPVPIEPPDNCPPPKELSVKHFNDRELLYYQYIRKDIYKTNNSLYSEKNEI